MFNRGGYRPHAHGEWIDAYNKSYSLSGCTGTIALQTFAANDRFVVVEL